MVFFESKEKILNLIQYSLILFLFIKKKIKFNTHGQKILIYIICLLERQMYTYYIQNKKSINYNNNKNKKTNDFFFFFFCFMKKRKVIKQ